MATPVLFHDGFDKYGPPNTQDFSVTNCAGEWASVSASATIVSPLSTYGAAVSLSHLQTQVSNTFSSVSRIVGSLRMQAVSGSAIPYISLRNGATAAFTIEISAANGLRLRTGTNAGGVIATGGSIVNGTTVVVSFDITIGASSSYTVYLDGSSTLSGTGNTGNGQSTVNTVVLGGTNSACWFDDLVLMDPTQAGYVSSILTNQAIVLTQFGTADTQTQFTNDGDVVIANGITATGVCRTVGATNAPGANQIYLIKVVPSISRTINSVSTVPGATSAGAKLKAVIYSDSAGSPDALLSDGVEVVGTTSGTTLTGALVTPQAITAGTAYWIGFYTDTSVILREYDSTTLGQKKANTYASGAPGTLSGMTTGQNTWLIWGNCTGSTVNWVATGRNPALATAASQVHSNTVSQEDLFSFPALLISPSVIYGVAVKGLVSKSDGGARTASFNVKSGGSDSTGSNSGQALSTTKQWQGSEFDTDPATGLAWTESGINSATSGYSVAS